MKAAAERDLAMLRRKVVKQDVKLAGAARDAANRERASELAEAKARARKQVAFLTAQVAQATKDAQAERLRKLRESIDSARVEDNKHLSRRESLVLSLDSSDDEEEDGSPPCSELLQALRSPREPGTAPWCQPRDPEIIKSVAAKIGRLKEATQNRSGLKGMDERIVDKAAVAEAKAMRADEAEAAMQFLLHEAELEALIVGPPAAGSKRFPGDRPSMRLAEKLW